MVGSYSLKLVDSLVNFQSETLKEVMDWVNQLEQSHAKLQQKVNQQTRELERCHQHLKDVLNDSQRMQRHLVQMEKMAMLGQMISGISHEINNPINFICGNLPHVEAHVEDLLKLIQAYQSTDAGKTKAVQTVLKEVDLDFLLDDLPRIIGSMKLGTDRIRSLVLTLRNFYRLDEAEMKPADLHEGICNTLLILHHRYKQEIEIIKEFGDIPLVECHINQLNQVFMNLLSNAIDALLEQPSVALEPATDHKPDAGTPKRIVIKTERLEGDRLVVSITDNGPGIPLEVQERLFEPFFTTKPLGIGTGLGLSISHQIVTENHRGRIFCCSAPGNGTTFMVELPIGQKR
ncbi:sensor histidine kinase [Leptothermofonsia sichuanensis E412]|uniref:sensor histidine kinase n=1 Tax=Leptothermofonsia sichuanensis TaxID=2917832 RepID=UPI001CA6ED83|nr:ATP-binding protein [Leptothermofonsia sichuanensis]QZZ21556.1 sensor histidine kinase [Leptothermofonsia sichuanensis E412]